MKINISLALSGLLLLSACRSTGDEPQPTPTPTPGAPQLSLTLGVPSGTATISLSATPTSSAEQTFLDLNGNGRRDAGEEVSTTKKDYILPSGATSLKLYGQYTTLDLTGSAVEQIQGEGLASLTELRLAGSSLSYARLEALAEALPEATQQTSRSLQIGEEQLSSELIQRLDAKGWKLLRASGSTIDPKESILIIRLEPKNGATSGASLSYTFGTPKDLWLDKNLNGTKDSGEELPAGAGVLEHPKEGRTAVYIFHGSASSLEVEVASSPGSDDNDEPGDEDEDEESDEDAGTEMNSLRQASSTASLVALEARLDVSRFSMLGFLNWSERSGLVSLQAKGATQLVNLAVSGNPLRELTLPTSTSVLRTLGISGNELTSLDLSAQTKLQTLSASSGKLTTIVLPKGLDLSTLSLPNNSLTELDLTQLPNLKKVNLKGNQLTKLTLGAAKYERLEDFDVSDNKLTSLDLLPLIKTQRIIVSRNPLTSVVWPRDLKELQVASTELVALDLTPVQGQTSFMQILDASGNPKLREIKVAQSRILKTIKLTATPALDLTKLVQALPQHSTASPGRLTIELSRLSAELQSQLKARGWTPVEK